MDDEKQPYYFRVYFWDGDHANLEVRVHLGCSARISDHDYLTIYHRVITAQGELIEEWVASYAAGEWHSVVKEIND